MRNVSLRLKAGAGPDLAADERRPGDAGVVGHAGDEKEAAEPSRTTSLRPNGLVNVLVVPARVVAGDRAVGVGLIGITKTTRLR
ncbi:hypothetical protein CPLU01_11924 [Colletotrichum plurivorum]|uniref:Uncharacterized protein n=1 Tax=Colletotrichum plurivorum TaxID=2175906 RepID=A0A8H6K0D3_9PEZI|nr:hypothetical protein CPLU01_11924 [Colletotrichum plurivorum]